MEICRIIELINCLKGYLDDKRLIVSGGFRDPEDLSSAPSVEIIEMDGLAAHTVKISVTDKPPIVSSDKPNTSQFQEKEKDGWLEGWKSVLTAAGIITPLLDATRLITLLHSKDRIRFCCDTNALASGVAIWALEMFHQQADTIITSAVVDREIMAWADRNSDMWKAKTCKNWAIRTQYRMARGLTEFPPPNLVIERLAPDQSALVLAKLRDEGGYFDSSQNRKSPDADILLVELVRGIVRDSPRNSKILFLTGDRNLARTATSALGSESVLFMISDKNELRKLIGKATARGWWRPGSSGRPLGRVHIPSVSYLFWYLLCACDYLFIEDSKGKKLAIRRVYSVSSGVPSDWTDPHVEIIEIKSQNRKNVNNHKEELKGKKESDKKSEDKNNWLLPIRKSDTILSDASKSLRLPPRLVFDYFLQILFNKKTEESDYGSDEVKNEIFKASILLDIIDEFYHPSKNFQNFKNYWINNDLDGIHSEFLKLPGYRTVFDTIHTYKDSDADILQNGVKKADFSKRLQVNINLGQYLGQLWIFDKLCFRGDNSLSRDYFVQKLNKWLPQKGDALSVYDLCVKASKEFKISPYRLEKAMIELWKDGSEFRFEMDAGGTVNKADCGTVVYLSHEQYDFIDIYPDGLKFGGTMPIRSITRLS